MSLSASALDLSTVTSELPELTKRNHILLQTTDAANMQVVSKDGLKRELISCQVTNRTEQRPMLGWGVRSTISLAIKMRVIEADGQPADTFQDWALYSLNPHHSYVIDSSFGNGFSIEANAVEYRDDGFSVRCEFPQSSPQWESFLKQNAELLKTP